MGGSLSSRWKVWMFFRRPYGIRKTKQDSFLFKWHSKSNHRVSACNA